MDLIKKIKEYQKLRLSVNVIFKDGVSEYGKIKGYGDVEDGNYDMIILKKDNSVHKQISISEIYDIIPLE